jgi:hypothetical protein
MSINFNILSALRTMLFRLPQAMVAVRNALISISPFGKTGAEPVSDLLPKTADGYT